MLRQLRNHPDVVAMSVDADVSPMSVAGVTGTAQGSPYSLRGTLGLDGIDPRTVVAAVATTSAKGVATPSLSLVAHDGAGSNRCCS